MRSPLNIDRATWSSLEAEKRRLRTDADAPVADRLRRGQRLSAQAAALRRAILRHEPPPRQS